MCSLKQLFTKRVCSAGSLQLIATIKNTTSYIEK